MPVRDPKAGGGTTYAQACIELIDCIKNNLLLDEDSLEALVEAQDSCEARKRLIVGLNCIDLISDEQASFAIGYRWSLKDA